ncbi:hypothetical protein D9M68_606680 [compost metagenome]
MQAVEAVVVAGAHEHEVVEFARDDVAFEAARHLLRRLLEIGEGVGRGAVEHHADHHEHADLERVGVQQGDHALDEARGPQPLDPAQAGRRAEVHLGGQRHVRHRGVALQGAQDGAVGAVELRRGAQLCCAHGFLSG